jgi:hypothetical protein
MRLTALLLTLCAASACGTAPGTFDDEDMASEDEPAELAESTQALSTVATDVFVAVLSNPTEPVGSVSLLGTDEDTNVQVWTNTWTPSGGGAAKLQTTLTLPALGVVSASAAAALFPQGVGMVRLRSVDNFGNPSPVPFVAYAGPADMQPAFAVGPISRGNRFRLPVLPSSGGAATRVRLAIGNLGAFQRVLVRSPMPAGFSTFVDLQNLQSYLWDSQGRAINFNGGGIVEIQGNSGGDLVVTALVERSGTVMRSVLIPLR